MGEVDCVGVTGMTHVGSSSEIIRQKKKKKKQQRTSVVNIEREMWRVGCCCYLVVSSYRQRLSGEQTTNNGSPINCGAPRRERGTTARLSDVVVVCMPKASMSLLQFSQSLLDSCPSAFRLGSKTPHTPPRLHFTHQARAHQSRFVCATVLPSFSPAASHHHSSALMHTHTLPIHTGDHAKPRDRTTRTKTTPAGATSSRFACSHRCV